MNKENRVRGRVYVTRRSDGMKFVVTMHNNGVVVRRKHTNQCWMTLMSELVERARVQQEFLDETKHPIGANEQPCEVAAGQQEAPVPDMPAS